MLKNSVPLLTAIAVLSLAACTVTRPTSTAAPGAPGAAPSVETGGAPSEQASAAPQPGEAGRPALPKQFHLGAAATALVAQSHQQASGGNYALATQTLERALRIEPENPLLWVELGQVRMQEGQAPQANGFGRKALALATGDQQAQAQAWRLIADSLRAQGRDPEAADAERRADALAPR